MDSFKIESHFIESLLMLITKRTHNIKRATLNHPDCDVGRC